MLTGKLTGAKGFIFKHSSGSAAWTAKLNNAAANNDYAGDTKIDSANTTLQLGAADQIPNSTGKGNVAVTGTLDLAGFSETINGLSGNGRIDNLSAATPSVLTLGDNDATATFGGGIRNTAALTTPTATVSLIKIGNGTQTLGPLTTNCGITLDSPTVTIGSTVALAPGMKVTGTGIPTDTTILAVVNATSFTLSQNATGTNTAAALTFTNANSYTGTTTVSGGTLLINGVQTLATGAVQVDATLGGTGTVGGEVTVAGTGKIAPGPVGTAGTLNINAKTTIGGTFACDIVTTTTTTTDKLVVTGDLILTGSTLTVNPISVGAGGTFVIATYTGTRTDALGEGSLPSGYSVIYDDTATPKEVKLVVPAAGYTKWAADNASGQAIDLDHDFDGVDNGIEYFMGQSGSGFTASPMLNASNKITWTMGTTYAGTYGTDYVIQTSSDLNTWASAPVGEVTILTGTSVSYTLGAGKRFVRLKVNK